jgi:hypothetical protein
MPCRDKTATPLLNPCKKTRIKPLHLCRVPAQGPPLIKNPLILFTKIGESRIFNPGTRPLRPHHTPDRVAQPPRGQQGTGVTVPRNVPARVPPFSGSPGTRPAPCGAFGGLKLTRNLVFLSWFPTSGWEPRFSARDCPSDPPGPPPRYLSAKTRSRDKPPPGRRPWGPRFSSPRE